MACSSGTKRCVIDPLGERELAVLIRAHTPQLFGLIRSLVADDAEAEDVLQDVWIIAAERAHRRRDGVPIGAWLHTVALNRARSLQRRALRRAWLVSLWTSEQSSAYVPAHTPSHNERTHEDMIRGRLWRAVADLPKLQREVVLLRVVEDLSTTEAAHRLGRANGTVKASLHRALRTLRGVLNVSKEELIDE